MPFSQTLGTYIQKAVTAQNQFSAPFEAFETGPIHIDISGTFTTSTWALQGTRDGGTTVIDLFTISSPNAYTFNHNDEALLLRVGCKTGDYAGSDSFTITAVSNRSLSRKKGLL